MDENTIIIIGCSHIEQNRILALEGIEHPILFIESIEELDENPIRLEPIKLEIEDLLVTNSISCIIQQSKDIEQNFKQSISKRRGKYKKR